MNFLSILNSTSGEETLMKFRNLDSINIFSNLIFKKDNNIYKLSVPSIFQDDPGSYIKTVKNYIDSVENYTGFDIDKNLIMLLDYLGEKDILISMIEAINKPNPIDKDGKLLIG